MKQIDISTDVFALIWSLRHPGEDTEDEILKRCLTELDTNLKKDNTLRRAGQQGWGVTDKRHNVQFPEGFEIFRTYRGVHFSARASRGMWILERNGQNYRTLNELSRAVSNVSENAWKSWNYRDNVGKVRRVSDLRNPTDVSRRSSMHSGSAARAVSAEPRWVDDVVSALQTLGGKAHLSDIYRIVKDIRLRRGASIPESLEAVVRKELEYHSSDSESYTGIEDLFYMVEGKGKGVWGLR